MAYNSQWGGYQDWHELEAAQEEYYRHRFGDEFPDKFDRYIEVRDILRSEASDDDMLEMLQRYTIGGLPDVYANVLNKYFPDVEDPYEYIGEVIAFIKDSPKRSR